MKRLITIFSLAFLPGLATSAELQLTPTICAVDENESNCSISVSVDFYADDERQYCLTIESKGLIRCFQGDIRDLEVYVNSDRDIRFQVSNSGQGVAAAILKVGHYQPKRHRRRYGWGLL